MESAIDTRQNNRIAPELLTYAGVAVACVLILVVTLHLWNADFHVPFGYTNGEAPGSGGDAMWIYMLAKSMIDTGWIQHNPNLGMPVGMNLLDFPVTEKLQLAIMKVIALASGDFAVTVNLYFLIGFVLTAMTMVALAREVGLSRITAVGIAILYAILPSHFLRGQAHLLIGAYYMVPLFILVCVWIVDARQLVFPLNRISSRGIAGLVICALAGFYYVYYAFFFGLFLLIAALFSSLRLGSAKRLLDPAAFVAVLTLSFLLCIRPNLVYRIQNGPNLDVLDRPLEDAAVYALQIAQMVLPTPGHRIPALAALRSEYDEGLPFVNENGIAVLGVIPTIGFFLLFWRVLRRLTGGAQHTILDALALFTIIALLVGAMGGFGAMFNLIFFRMIRSYNRISVFIAGFSLLALGIGLEKLSQNLFSELRRRIAYPMAIIVLVLIGAFDQTTPQSIPAYASIKADFDSDRVFVKQIESVVPEGSMIYQLPEVSFPEQPRVERLTDYQLFRGYLHSTKLRWSYGAMRGREIEEWNKKAANPMADQKIATVRREGFAGLYVDTYGFKDRLIVTNLQKLLKTDPIVSPNGRLVFFSLLSGAEPLVR